MVAHLRREHHRITVAITELQSSQQVLDTLLTAALRQSGEGQTSTDGTAPGR